MRRIARALIISLLVVGVTAGCNDKTGGGTKPGSGSSQNGGGGY